MFSWLPKSGCGARLGMHGMQGQTAAAESDGRKQSDESRL